MDVIKIIDLTQQYVQSLFNYKDGNLYWKKINVKNQVKIGDHAGHLNNRYYVIKINSKNYKLHQIIFLYHYGYIPKEIDHIDNDPLNNQIENLREVTHYQNMMNQKSTKNTSSIYKGVSWRKQNRKWVVQIQFNGKKKYLGLFTNEIDAALAYNIKAIECFGKYAWLNKLL